MPGSKSEPDQGRISSFSDDLKCDEPRHIILSFDTITVYKNIIFISILTLILACRMKNVNLSALFG